MRLESTLREGFERLLLAAIQGIFPRTTGRNGSRRWHLSGYRHECLRILTAAGGERGGAVSSQTCQEPQLIADRIRGFVFVYLNKYASCRFGSGLRDDIRDLAAS